MHIRKESIWKISFMIVSRLETWSLTLREEHRLRVFERRVLRRIFRSKRERSGRRMEKTA